jgi:hypothetical protein
LKNIESPAFHTLCRRSLQSAHMKNKNQSYNQEVRQCLSQMRLAEFKTVQIYYLASERHQEKFEDTKDVIRSCNSKKDRQYNVGKK